MAQSFFGPDAGRCAPRPRAKLWPVILFRLGLYGALVAAFVYGGPVIRAAAVCAVPLALLADCAGGLRHTTQMLGLGVAFWLAPAFGGALGGVVSSLGNVSPLMARGVGVLLIGLGIVIAFAAAGYVLSRKLKTRPRLRGFDHVCGALMGTAEGALVVACCCWLLAVFETPMETMRAKLARSDQHSAQVWILDHLAEARVAIAGDPVGRWVTQANPLTNVSAVQDAQFAAEMAADSDRLLAAFDAGRLDAIADLPEVRSYVEAFQNDPAMMRAWEQGDTAAIMSSPQVRAMLTDADLRRVLLAHREDFRRAINTDQRPTR